MSSSPRAVSGSPGKLNSLPAWVFSQPRAEAAGLERAVLEGEAQQRTLPWNQTSTLPLMDFKGKSGLGGGTEDSGVLEGQN